MRFLEGNNPLLIIKYIRYSEKNENTSKREKSYTENIVSFSVKVALKEQFAPLRSKLFPLKVARSLEGLNHTEEQITSQTDSFIVRLSLKTYVFEDKLTKYESL